MLLTDITKISEWLTIINYRINQMDNFKKRTRGTVKWILADSQFSAWFSGFSGILWGIGMPGAGKTVLASAVIDYLLKLEESDEDICVAFAYCRYSDKQVTAEDVLGSLIRQQLERHPAIIMHIVKPMYDRHVREKTRPSQEDLLSILQNISSSGLFKKSFYAVDGLDEASSDLQFEILDSLAALPVNFFITSRRLESLKELVPDAKFFEIVARNEDICALIEEKVQRMPALRKLLKDDGLKKQVVSRILKKSSGMFLLASLQLDLVGRCLNVSDLRNALECLPEGINDMYSTTMERVESQGHSDIVHRVLTWLVYANRSLLIEELRHAVAVYPQTYAFDRERLIDQESLLSLCCGLVTVEQNSGVVRLIHYTAKDFLMPYLLRYDQDPQASLASTCVALLLQCGFHTIGFCARENKTNPTENDVDANEDDDDVNYQGYEDDVAIAFAENPFLKYSHKNWAPHALASDPLPFLVIDFVQQCQGYPFDFYGDGDLDALASIHVIAAHNFPALLTQPDTSLVNVDVNLKSLRDRRTALVMSASRGHLEVVHALLRFQGIDINASDLIDMTPLMHASANGHTAVVKALLNVNDCAVNASNVLGQTALVEAVLADHTEIVRALLEVDGIDVDFADEEGCTALMHACEHGRVAITRALLDANADLNLTDS
ncbi:hypothetical protein FA15DRAFT_714696 [Coprinopsis marcescibilis]|uniref:Uncharacterized protein n=1 Tax=Coprinopsis marcescibilis TaxID=230819 RepID=A0A5C3KNQ5_COPMA|nr:hypothetical protein FA15DRAFT_714696 [Coprinopsis marcescibilis]